MSIALWKTVLTLAKAFAVLVLVAAGALYWSHRTAMAAGWKCPDFTPQTKVAYRDIGKTDNLNLQLGRFQREKPKVEAPKVEDKGPDIEGEIAKLGEITDAIILFEPYGDDGLAPAIIFKFRAGGEVRTIRLGEALVEKPNPRSALHAIPVRFKFLGCERDPEKPGVTLFKFDVNCDGKDIQSARWKFEEPAKPLPKAEEGGPAGPTDVVTDKVFIGGPLSSRPPEEPAKPGETVQPVPTPPVVPEPVPEPITVEQAPAGTLFDTEDGVFAPTSEGADYLEKNYEDVLKQTRTESAKGGGIRIVGISNQQLAGQFGILAGDVILRINGTPVSSQSEAVNVVKQKLKLKGSSPILTVTIRRRGVEKDLRFDTRDPATRRAAKKAGYK